MLEFNENLFNKKYLLAQVYYFSKHHGVSKVEATNHSHIIAKLTQVDRKEVLKYFMSPSNLGKFIVTPQELLDYGAIALDTEAFKKEAKIVLGKSLDGTDKERQDLFYEVLQNLFTKELQSLYKEVK